VGVAVGTAVLVGVGIGLLVAVGISVAVSTGVEVETAVSVGVAEGTVVDVGVAVATCRLPSSSPPQAAMATEIRAKTEMERNEQTCINMTSLGV
jgi:hypothetical protein